jgi:hypothetical protein
MCSNSHGNDELAELADTLVTATQLAGHTPFVGWREIRNRHLSAGREWMPFIKTLLSTCDLLILVYEESLRGGLCQVPNSLNTPVRKLRRWNDVSLQQKLFCFLNGVIFIYHLSSRGYTVSRHCCVCLHRNEINAGHESYDLGTWKPVLRGKLIRRTIFQPLVWSLLIVKVDPIFCCLKKFTKGPVSPSFCNSKLKDANKAFCIPIICRSTSSAHRSNKAFFEGVW